MSSPIACVMCAVDPAATSMLLPLAQATIISAPILLRGRIRRGVRAARARWGGPAAEPVAERSGEAAEREDESRSRG